MEPPLPKVISATEFKATCLDSLDRVATGELDRVQVTKRGRVVAVLVPPTPGEAALAGLHGFLIPPELDLTAPGGKEPFTAEPACCSTPAR